MDPKAYGLTGGIACGKSTVSDLLAARGWGVIDTDAIAHELMAPGQANWKNVVDAFGPSILKTDQSIDRQALGELVFSQPSQRRRLNELTHPTIRETWRARREEFFQTHPSSPLVVMIPLLFEAGLASEFSRTVCVACSETTQWARLLARDWSQDHARQRLASQWAATEKMNYSDYVIWNEGSRDCLQRQLDWLA